MDTKVVFQTESDKSEEKESTKQVSKKERAENKALRPAGEIRWVGDAVGRAERAADCLRATALDTAALVYGADARPPARHDAAHHSS